jgi:hypothetical protein
MSATSNSYHTPHGTRMCAVCRQAQKPLGLYLPVLDRPKTQQWICESCVVKATSPIVIELVFEGHLSLTYEGRSAAVRASVIRVSRPLDMRGRRRTQSAA